MENQSRIKLVVGLGNPGRQYVRTRHNAGFMVLEVLADRWRLGQPKNAFQGQLADARVGDCRVLLLAPQTYMNRSGQSVAAAAAFYKVAAHDVLVVSDDLALPPGRLRARPEGSAGGHNGLQDVFAALGGNNVSRLRIGIGPSPAAMDSADYVLAPMGERDLNELKKAAVLAAVAVEDWVFHGIRYVMDKYNRKEAADKSDSDTKERMQEMNEKAKTYEAMFMLDAGNPDFQAVSEPVRNILARYEAEVLSIKPWDERRLSYEILGRKRALYILAYFKIDPLKVKEVEHDCRLDERILRALVLRRDNLTEAEINAVTPATGGKRVSDLPNVREEESDMRYDRRPRRPEAAEVADVPAPDIFADADSKAQGDAE